MLNILIDTSPLAGGHAMRGIGMYTKLLIQELENLTDITVERATAPGSSEFKPDIVHYPYFDLFFSTLPWRRQAPTVVTVHDVIPLIFPEKYQPGFRGRMRYWRQKATLKTAQAVITDSEASKQDIIKYLGISADKVHVVYLAANPDFKPAAESAIKKAKRVYGLPKKYILYVGDINYNKNIPQLIKALKFLPEDLHLVCVGKNFSPNDIPEWQWIETQIALSDVASRVHFIDDIGGQDTSDLAAIYSGAFVYVQPSLYEGFGLPVLEAMQCQAPVVCTKTSSLIEVGREYAVFTQTEAESLAHGVITVAEWSEQERALWVKKAAAWASTFSWQKTAAATVEVYRQLAGKS